MFNYSNFVLYNIHSFKMFEIKYKINIVLNKT